MMTKAFAYLRVSGKGQVDGDGFPRQAEAIDKYAKAHGCVVVQTFQEKGVSGTNDLDDREALAQLVEQLESNGVRTVLVENATRLARDLMIQEMILSQFRKLGVAVIAVDAGQDLVVADDDPTRVLIRQVLGAGARGEKSMLVRKLQTARQRIRRVNGRCEGRKPYGTQPAERRVVALIKGLRIKQRGEKRMGFRTVAKQLNRLAIPTRSGGQWDQKTVYQVAKGELFAEVEPVTEWAPELAAV